LRFYLPDAVGAGERALFLHEFEILTELLRADDQLASRL
jgi:hypothetical protein